MGAWARAFDSHQIMKGAEAPGWEVGASRDPLISCEVEAMAELVTERLAELVSARLSDGVVFRCNQPTRYMTATGAAKRAKRKANNINSFSMATSCQVTRHQLSTNIRPGPLKAAQSTSKHAQPDKLVSCRAYELLYL